MSPEYANRAIGNYIGIAVLLGVVAGILFAVAGDGGDTAEIAAVIGIGVLAVAGFLLLVGAVGLGVKYGVAAARVAPAVTPAKAAGPKADA